MNRVIKESSMIFTNCALLIYSKTPKHERSLNTDNSILNLFTYFSRSLQCNKKTNYSYQYYREFLIIREKKKKT